MLRTVGPDSIMDIMFLHPTQYLLRAVESLLMIVLEEFRLRIKLGDAELDIAGDKEFVSRMSKEFEYVLKEASRAPPEPSSHNAPAPKTHPKPGSPPSAGETPKTVPAKLEALRNEGYFSEPKDSSAVTEELRARGWGIYKANDISSTLKKVAPRFALRRVDLGERRYGYTYP